MNMRTKMRIARCFIVPPLILTALCLARGNQSTIDRNAIDPVAPNSVVAYESKCEHATGIPGHVIMVREGHGKVIYTANPELIHEALEQEFNNGPTHHNVMEFCQ